MHTTKTWLGLVATGLLTNACGGAPSDAIGSQETAASAAGSVAAGLIPAGLPARVEVGLFEGTGKTWMKDSGVPWDMRYQYFTKGWVDNWGWGNERRARRR